MSHTGGATYEPEWFGYVRTYEAKGIGSEPQGFGYEPQGFGYEPEVLGYEPQGFGYEPQGFGYEPQGFGCLTALLCPAMSCLTALLYLTLPYDRGRSCSPMLC